MSQTEQFRVFRESLGCTSEDLIARWPPASIGDNGESPNLRTSGTHIDDSAAQTFVFTGPAASVHDIHIDFSDTPDGIGLALEYTLRNWEQVHYVAIGWWQDGVYHHVKTRHTYEDSWRTASLFLGDLLLKAQQVTTPPVPKLNNVRFFVKGTPSGQGAYVGIRNATIWHGRSLTAASVDTSSPALRRNLRAVTRMLRRDGVAQTYTEDLNRYKDSGELSLLPGKPHTWPLSNSSPAGPDENATLRFSWHALHPLAHLATEAVRAGDADTLRSVAEMAVQWVGAHAQGRSNDPRYAWYDHGTAERSNSLLLILLSADGVLGSFARRLLSYTALQHARLLATDAFYAANQRSRYHNHAWFQDIALLVASTAYDSAESRIWHALALGRLTDQFNTLIVRDSGYAVFSENSIGYHHGVAGMVRFAGEIDDRGEGGNILEIARQMDSWSDLFRYPDGTVPAQGDTYRLRPGSRPSTHLIRRSSHILPTAGYAVAHGIDGSSPYSLFLYNTGTNDTHKHQDNASFTLHFAAVEWFTDPSFFSHEYEAQVPAYLRGKWAHNAVVLPNIEPSLDPETASCTLGGQSGDEFDFCAAHSAYAGTKMTRRVAGELSRLSLTFEDTISGPHSGVLVLHLGPGVTIAARNTLQDHVELLLRHSASDRALRVRLPGQSVHIVEGLGTEAAETSIVGFGFREYEASVSIHAPVDHGKKYRWSVEAV